MDNQIKIGDFVKLTGSTLKTVLYYHKAGLLPEPERSAGGYRVYGAVELSRMRMIRHLKGLGLGLPRIRDILGGESEQKTLREVLQSLRTELANEKDELEARIAKIDKLLEKETAVLKVDDFATRSFEAVTETLGAENIRQYAGSCPEIYEQQRKVFGILEDFEWGENYQQTFQSLADFFKAHPEEYQTALDYGRRLARLSQLEEDDPEVEALARESARFIRSMPQLTKILCRQAGINGPLAGVYNDLVESVVPPAQVRHGHLLRQYLGLGREHSDG